MKKLILLMFLLFLLSPVYAINTTTSTSELETIKSLYKGYMDSALFMPIAIAIFSPIVIIGLFGMIVNIKGILSLFALGMFLGILMFLLFPYILRLLSIDMSLML